MKKNILILATTMIISSTAAIAQEREDGSNKADAPYASSQNESNYNHAARNDRRSAIHEKRAYKRNARKKMSEMRTDRQKFFRDRKSEGRDNVRSIRNNKNMSKKERRSEVRSEYKSLKKDKRSYNKEYKHEKREMRKSFKQHKESAGNNKRQHMKQTIKNHPKVSARIKKSVRNHR